MSNFAKIVKTQINSEHFMRKVSSCKFDIYFLGLSEEIFFGVITKN